MSDRENAEDVSPELVEDEDTGSQNADAAPWDPGKIRITTRHLSLRDVVTQISDNEIDLSPDFQRDFVWKRRQRTRLVESILLGIPLPAFYFNQESDATYQVVDGVQRLSTVSLFMADGHRLEGQDLQYLNDLDGLTYSQLDPSASRRFRGTQIVIHVIEPQTPDEVKYDIFSRVNTLGSPLSTQEIRHAMSKERSRQFLKELSELPSFDRATESQFWRRDPGKGPVRDSGRMTSRELVLRFCAFHLYSDAEYRQFSGLDSFLVEFTRRLDNRSKKGSQIDDAQLTMLKDNFDRAMENAHFILEKDAFRRPSSGQRKRGPINRALFEAQAVAFSAYPTAQLISKKPKIAAAFRRLFDDPDYVRSVTVGTGDPRAVERRIMRTKAALEGAIR
ncbi:DUF262 domain-containing protein [Paraburkholderia sp. GAS199]|uniref:DUF262 domain-containing protein n=1 Tax=Paraburkholderia sp. GAS199 TaxID=3035126 RepID=UPI003D216CA3